MASRGTNSSPKKSAAASLRVTASSVTRRVRLSAPEPGSLKPMWPVLPMPRIWKSMPPARAISCSYSRAAASTSCSRALARRDVDVRRIDVDVREEILPHEAMVGVDALLRHRVVLVEIERHDVGEAQPFVAMHADQLAIDPDRRRAGGEAEDCPRPAA